MSNGLTGLVINTNMAAVTGQRILHKTSDEVSTAMTRLSSGLRINSAADDAAGMAITTRMTSQIRGMTVAMRNANEGISMAQTAEGAIGELTGIMQRMRDLALQAANTGAVSKGNSQKLQDEFKQMGSELKRIIQNTSFNGLKLLTGDVSAKMFQIGWSTGTDNQISITISTLTGLNAAGGISALFGVSTYEIGSNASPSMRFSAIKKLDAALNSVNDTRAKLGAIQNRFMATISNLEQSIENNTAAKSRIMDADFAVESSNLARSQILQQAGTAMLAQANQASQSVLKLLQ